MKGIRVYSVNGEGQPDTNPMVELVLKDNKVIFQGVRNRSFAGRIEKGVRHGGKILTPEDGEQYLEAVATTYAGARTVIEEF